MRLWWQFEGKIALRADYRRRALPDDANAVRWREKVCEEGLVGVARQPALISRAPRIVMGAFLGPSTVLPVTGAQRLKRVEWWEDEQSKAVEKAKSAGVEVREHDAARGATGAEIEHADPTTLIAIINPRAIPAATGSEGNRLGRALPGYKQSNT
jgi:hypothetical protein